MRTVGDLGGFVGGVDALPPHGRSASTSREGVEPRSTISRALTPLLRDQEHFHCLREPLTTTLRFVAALCELDRDLVEAEALGSPVFCAAHRSGAVVVDGAS